MELKETRSLEDTQFRSQILVPFILISIYIVIVIIHIVLLSSYLHPGIGVYFRSDSAGNIGNFVGDEAAYRIYAESLLHLEAYPTTAAYPPAYPLVLALAELLWPTDPMKAMVLANIAVASAVLFPIYALARQILARDWAFAAAIATGLLPASFIFAPALMSENLFLTGFATAFWMAVRQRPATRLISGLFGATLAACFLTKFLSLALIPLLAVASIINQLQLSSHARGLSKGLIVRRALVAILVGAIPVALWVAYFVGSGGSADRALGYSTATLAFTGPKGWHLPPLHLIWPILGLNGLAIAGSVLPVLPAVMAGIFTQQNRPLSLYLMLVGATAVFIWLLVTVYGWLALLLFEYPQPIYQRYCMMLVPIFVPLAFFGVKQVLDWTAGWRGWRALAAASLLSVALAGAVQAGLYDRAIWPVPAWITVIWVGGPDVLYGALGFPVIAVTAAAVSILVVVRLAGWIGPRLSVKGRRALRLALIAAATASLAVFQVAAGLAGTHFAWDSPYIAINAAHARAIAAIIEQHGRERQQTAVIVEPAVLDSIEKSSGVRFDQRRDFLMSLSFWSGRQVFVLEPENPLASKARYHVSVAHQDADPAILYRVGTETFQVQTAPDR